MDRSALGSVGLSCLALLGLAFLALTQVRPDLNAVEEVAVKEEVRSQVEMAEEGAQERAQIVVLPAPPTGLSPKALQEVSPEALPKVLPEVVPDVSQEHPVELDPIDQDPVEPAPAEPEPVALEPLQVAEIKETPKPFLTETQVEIDAETVAEGRVLLRMMARGEGPNIQIAWPQSSGDRDRLYQRLTQCYGMVSAIMTREGHLYREEGPSGEPWQINRDKFSDFLREAQGRLPGAESVKHRAIQSRHGVAGTVVRVLPRSLDAGLVGALMRLADQLGSSAPVITAYYVIDSHGVRVANIAINGREMQTVIPLPSPALRSASNCSI